ncbi:hypothetical protein FOA52_008733 [Chlamydomonas sp. UWO 241]|nr:hypothetical protein FOA52_008733 [Chlamydomonas sp. UWO 241]
MGVEGKEIAAGSASDAAARGSVETQLQRLGLQESCGAPAAAAAAAAGTAATPATPAPAQHPFQTEPGDHAETPVEAYAHIALLLSRLAKRLGKPPSQLRIYDPFYCEGRVVEHLTSLGFESVYNVCEDFYVVAAAGRTPEFDVVVTNPPFSGDHIENTLNFMVHSRKPWFLLVPQYVARKVRTQ